ncbi:MAG TPA: hypothetical protein VHB98_13795 [Chloroflexota bacterium]|nr:hypothetical protein [Chloroflexota bacterium]
MSRGRRRDTPEWLLEQALIDAYYAHRWREVLSPLATALHAWEAGEGDPADVAHEAARLHKQASALEDLFTQKREYIVRLIEFDQDWSLPWLAAHPRPAAEATADAHFR